MEFKPAKCPSCGGNLQIPDDREMVKCMYCGNEIVVKKAIAAAAVANLPALKEIALVSQEAGNYDKAIKHWEEILKIDPMNAEAWEQKGICYFNQASKYGDITVSMLVSGWEKILGFKLGEPPKGKNIKYENDLDERVLMELRILGKTWGREFSISHPNLNETVLKVLRKPFEPK